MANARQVAACAAVETTLQLAGEHFFNKRSQVVGVFDLQAELAHARYQGFVPTEQRPDGVIGQRERLADIGHVNAVAEHALGT